jgi:outer membrane lipopolysaccharide assembly protein LptE/RlpB
MIHQFRRILTTFVLILVLTITTACSGTVQAKQPNTNLPVITSRGEYALLERGNTQQGQDFGNWVVQTAKGLINDAYVRDNNKLGVVITPQVRPNEVQPLARSLVQGFHRNFPNQDLTVLVYAPDKKLIVTAQYDTQSNQVKYQ